MKEEEWGLNLRIYPNAIRSMPCVPAEPDEEHGKWYEISGEDCSVRIKEEPRGVWTIFVFSKDGKQAFKLIAKDLDAKFRYYFSGDGNKVQIIDDYNAKMVETGPSCFPPKGGPGSEGGSYGVGL